MVKNTPANGGDIGSVPDREDPTGHIEIKPMHHNYLACALEPMLHNMEATTVRSPVTTMKSNLHQLQLEKAHMLQQRPSTAKNK